MRRPRLSLDTTPIRELIDGGFTFAGHGRVQPKIQRPEEILLRCRLQIKAYGPARDFQAQFAGQRGTIKDDALQLIPPEFPVVRYSARSHESCRGNVEPFQ